MQSMDHWGVDVTTTKQSAGMVAVVATEGWPVSVLVPAEYCSCCYYCCYYLWVEAEEVPRANLVTPVQLVGLERDDVAS